MTRWLNHITEFYKKTEYRASLKYTYRIFVLFPFKVACLHMAVRVANARDYFKIRLGYECISLHYEPNVTPAQNIISYIWYSVMWFFRSSGFLFIRSCGVIFGPSGLYLFGPLDSVEWTSSHCWYAEILVWSSSSILLLFFQV